MQREILSTPILFIAFNRLDTTRKVFEVIRQVKPLRLYIAVDGPRNAKPGEELKVQAVRDHLMGNIDWQCEVKTLFREKNLGCQKAVSTAIDWFFENEEEGIILEDDCLPDVSFFPFCAQLLEKYRHDENVMMISGDNFQGEEKTCSCSYYFSKYCHIWGWASWRRAWKYYDGTMRLWPQVRAHGFLKMVDPEEQLYWRWCFDQVFSGRLNTWDYQWVFACWVNKGLVALPVVNLVSNIGFGDEGTHTKKGNNRMAALQANRLQFPLIHPENITVNHQADKRTQDVFFKMSFFKYIWLTFKEIVRIK